MPLSMGVGSIGFASDPVANQEKIFNAGRIPYASFRSSIGVLFATATLAFVGRILTRLYTRRRIFLDDAFLIFSFVCLTAATFLLYKFANVLYINEAVKLDATVVVSPQDLIDVAYSLAYIDAFLALIWTSIYLVKFSFLALFRILLRQLPKKIVIYFWLVVASCIVTWMFVVSEPFILCPHFGMNAIKCQPEPPFILSLVLTILVTILDIVTDIMIVTIPIIILRKTQMKPSQQFRLAVFLCLSIVMALVALTRISAYRLHGVLDLTWQIFWMWTEGAIAMMMGSTAAFRALLLIREGSRQSADKAKKSGTLTQDRLIKKLKWWEADTACTQGSDPESLNRISSVIPTGRLTGFTAYFRMSNSMFATTTVTEIGADPVRPSESEEKFAGSETWNRIHVQDRFEVSSNDLSRNTAAESKTTTKHDTTITTTDAGGIV